MTAVKAIATLTADATSAILGAALGTLAAIAWRAAFEWQWCQPDCTPGCQP